MLVWTAMLGLASSAAFAEDGDGFFTASDGVKIHPDER
jgi:hypothetical protein